MNIPNALTISRILLTFGFIYFFSRDGLAAKLFAALFFCVASLTDYLDGHIARRKNRITNLGKIMDPIADKFLILSAFFVLARIHMISPVIFAIIAIREIMITILRLFAIKKGKVLAAETAGKLKTVTQITAILCGLLFLILAELIERQGAMYTLDIYQQSVVGGLMVLTVMITLYSGLMFLWNNRRVLHV